MINTIKNNLLPYAIGGAIGFLAGKKTERRAQLQTYDLKQGLEDVDSVLKAHEYRLRIELLEFQKNQLKKEIESNIRESSGADFEE